MRRALIFDCDGVIADTEPLHLAAFRGVLADEGIDLSTEEYFQHYLALDDRGCFTKVFADRGRALAAEDLSRLVERKAERLEPVIRRNAVTFPGVKSLVEAATGEFMLAVASGARRSEVEIILEASDLRRCFPVIVAAEDVTRGKPDPEPFITAKELLIDWAGTHLEASGCIVIEDSIHGVRAAHLAGMKCLAVTNSYSRHLLSGADLVVDSLTEVSLTMLDSILASR